MKILILGASGLLGHRLFLDLQKQHQVLGMVRTFPEELLAFGASREDFVEGLETSNLELIEKTLVHFLPDVVINAVGYVKQRKELDEELMYQINGRFPRRVGELCGARDIYFIHFSTDCVFSGTRGNYGEDDTPDCSDLYGLSKLAGEISGEPQTLTLRTSIIGREIRNFTGLYEWFLSQPSGAQVSGFQNVWWSGYPTSTISKILNKIVDLGDRPSGLYNLASKRINKFELLRLFSQASGHSVEVVPVAEPQMDRSLDGKKLKEKVGFQVKEWQHLVKDILVDSHIYNELKS